jgi:Kef-type K+ transport system membrane component KefB
MENFFFQLTVVIFLAATLSIIFRFLKQPPILAFIITGVLVGPLGPFGFSSEEFMKALASIGITLLLFIIGLELNIKELKVVGKSALLIGGFQLVFTTLAGFSLSIFLGFSVVTSLYIGIGLALSSTILIIKLLSDKRDLKSLYGKIVIGVLVLQDIVAIFILIILSTLKSTSGSVDMFSLLFAGLKIILLFSVVIFLSRQILPKFLNVIAKNSESLFLFSLAWVFGIAALVSSPLIGFSIEIGGLLAGIALASSIESYQIITKVKPLRDFFLTIFFVTLGMEITLINFSQIIIPVIVLSIFLLFISPIIVMIIMGALKYKKRTSFFTGIALAQISEFSLIMVYMGYKIGHLTPEIVSIMTFVGVISFVVSTYFIMYSNSLYKFFSPILDVFEMESTNLENKPEQLNNHVILVGANRMGEGILNALLGKNEEVIVVDFDPDIIAKLNEKQIKTFFGDISDPEIQDAVNIEKASLIISTVSDPEDALLLLKNIKKLKGPKVIVAAFEKTDARQFYAEGADYVIMPHIAGGNHLAKLLMNEDHLRMIEEYKDKEKSYVS